MNVMPDFVKSEYFVPEVDNWHLKEGAPDDVREEFEEYMRIRDENHEKGIY